jgi:hypothetical protein
MLQIKLTKKINQQIIKNNDSKEKVAKLHA